MTPGQSLYELVCEVMVKRFGSSAHSVAWEKMDTGRPESQYPEKEAWEEIAQRFTDDADSGRP